MKALSLHPGEQLLFTYRETELVLLKPLLVVAIIVAVPWYFFIKYGLVGQFDRVLLLYTFIALLVGLRYWFIWYLKRYVLTSERLVHISHYGLFKKRVAETPLQRILNVSYKTTGIISSLFHFGDVEVQVVGLIEPILLKNINHPAQIKDYLWELHGKQKGVDPLVSAENIPHLEEEIGYEKPLKS